MSKLIAAGLSIVFFYSNVLAGPLAEANFWAERRKAVAWSKKPVGGGPVGSGTFTLSPASDQPGAHEKPSAPYGAHSTAQGHIVFHDTIVPRLAPSPRPFTRQPTPDWLGSAIGPYGEIHEMSPASSNSAASHRFVILVQDAHGLVEAQRNIAHILRRLIEQRGVTLIGLEGSQGRFDLTPFRSLSDQTAVAAIAEYLLKVGLLTGPEVAGLLAQPGKGHEPLLWGLEEPSLYLRNLRAVQEAESLLGWWRGVNARWTSQRRSPDLVLLEKLLNHSLTPSEWAIYQGRRPTILKQLKHLTLAPPGTSELVRGEPSWVTPFERFYQLAEARNDALVSNLLAKMEALGSDPNSTPSPLVEGGGRSSGPPTRMAVRGGARKEGSLARRTGAPSQRWVPGRANKPDRAQARARAGERPGTRAASVSVDCALPGPRAQRGGGEGKPQLAVLVAGGFHTPGLTRLLKRRRVAYAVISPRITKVDQSAHYLAELTRPATPLERLFAGDKLYLHLGHGLAPVPDSLGAKDGYPQRVHRTIMGVWLISYLAWAMGTITNGVPSVRDLRRRADELNQAFRLVGARVNVRDVQKTHFRVQVTEVGVSMPKMFAVRVGAEAAIGRGPGRRSPEVVVTLSHPTIPLTPLNVVIAPTEGGLSGRRNLGETIATGLHPKNLRVLLGFSTPVLGLAWLPSGVLGVLSHPLLSVILALMSGWLVSRWLLYKNLARVTQERDNLRGQLQSAKRMISVLLDLGKLKDARLAALRTDPLTGLETRAVWNKRFGNLYSRVMYDRYQEAIGTSRSPEGREGVIVLFMDINNFKSINDQRGHAAGDRALQRVGEILKQKVRPGDLVARYGGDEFVLAAIVAENRVEEYLHQVAQRIRSELNKHPDPVSLNIGVAHQFSLSAATVARLQAVADRGRQRVILAKKGEQLVRVADKSMYVAKWSGSGVHVFVSGTLQQWRQLRKAQAMNPQGLGPVGLWETLPGLSFLGLASFALTIGLVVGIMSLVGLDRLPRAALKRHVHVSARRGMAAALLLMNLLVLSPSAFPQTFEGQKAQRQAETAKRARVVEATVERFPGGAAGESAVVNRIRELQRANPDREVTGYIEPSRLGAVRFVWALGGAGSVQFAEKKANVFHTHPTNWGKSVNWAFYELTGIDSRKFLSFQDIFTAVEVEDFERFVTGFPGGRVLVLQKAPKGSPSRQLAEQCVNTILTYKNLLHKELKKKPIRDVSADVLHMFAEMYATSALLRGHVLKYLPIKKGVQYPLRGSNLKRRTTRLENETEQSGRGETGAGAVAGGRDR